MTHLRNAGSELAHGVQDRPLLTDGEIVELMNGLVGGAILRQLWFQLIDSEQRPMKALISIRDLPVEAGAVAIGPLAALIAEAVALEPGASVVVV